MILVETSYEKTFLGELELARKVLDFSQGRFLKSSSIAKARGSITKNFHEPLENLRSDPRRTVPFVPGTELGTLFASNPGTVPALFLGDSPRILSKPDQRLPTYAEPKHRMSRSAGWIESGSIRPDLPAKSRLLRSKSTLFSKPQLPNFTGNAMFTR